jgi:hypothetical protein
LRCRTGLKSQQHQNEQTAPQNGAFHYISSLWSAANRIFPVRNFG